MYKPRPHCCYSRCKKAGIIAPLHARSLARLSMHFAPAATSSPGGRVYICVMYFPSYDGVEVGKGGGGGSLGRKVCVFENAQHQSPGGGKSTGKAQQSGVE